MWKKGPLPPGTWHWGGVVLQGDNPTFFHFADFRGNHAIIYPGNRAVGPDEIKFYCNCLEMPPQDEAQEEEK